MQRKCERKKNEILTVWNSSPVRLSACKQSSRSEVENIKIHPFLYTLTRRWVGPRLSPLLPLPHTQSKSLCVRCQGRGLGLAPPPPLPPPPPPSNAWPMKKLAPQVWLKNQVRANWIKHLNGTRRN